MKLKKAASLALSAVLAGSLLAGCGGTASSSSSAASTSTPGSTTSSVATAASGKITFSAWDVESQATYIKTLVDAFTAQNPGIEVELVDMPSADYTNNLNINLNGGSAADVFLIKDADTSYSLNEKGQLADLSEFVKRDSVDLTEYNGLAENFSFEGKQIGIPFRTDYNVLYYNKDLFDAAGEAYPSNDMTWTEFEALAKKLTSGSGADKNYGALLHTWQACVQNWAVQDGKNTIMGPDYEFFKPYYEMALRMQNDDKSVPDYASLKTGNIHYSAPFMDGNAAMLPMGSWFMSTMISKVKEGETDVNWGVATIPHPEGLTAGNTVGSTTPIAINEASQNKEAAWEFVRFATGAEGAKVLAEAGQFPGRVDDTLLKTITSIEGMPEGALEAMQVKGIVLDRPIVPFVNEVNQMLGEEHGLIMLGEASIDDGLATMSERSKEIQGA